jgi:hapalindole-type alkaloid chlorinase
MIENSPLFHFLTFSADEMADNTIIKKLLNEDITGIVFKNFLSKEEVLSVKNHLAEIPKAKKTIINEGFHSYPLSFAQFTQMRNAGIIETEDYVRIAEDVLKNQHTEIGLNITQKLIDFLEKFEVFGKVSPIIETNSQKPLVPFNVRELFPGNGELVVHCENLFFNEFPGFFNWLKIMDIKDNKLSYFITIQKPETGGELCCYDMNWRNVKQRKSHTELLDESGNTIDINDNNLKKHLIKPDEGDLLLFAGGNVWHKVLTVEGSLSRITIGGFIAETNTPEKHYIWS